MTAPPTVSIVVPTYRREEPLVGTVRALLALAPPPLEILVVDQTPRHAPATTEALGAWERAGAIRTLRPERASIPGAMNLGLRAAAGEVVLFVDDDVEPARDLVAAHARAHAGVGVAIVAGQVLEPGQSPEPLDGARFAFRSSVPQEVDEFVGCNVSVRRATALALGGFDENFVAVAYRFEAEFAERARRAGHRVLFEPAASLLHLRAPAGGVRAYGDHRRTLRPSHAVGEYYFLFVSRGARRWRRMAARPFRAVRTRFHLRHPWWIPGTLLAELLGWLWAGWLRLRGARTLRDPLAGAASP